MLTSFVNEGGATRKLPGALRALQVMHEVMPRAPVALVDSSDLLIANRFMPAHAELVLLALLVLALALALACFSSSAASSAATQPSKPQSEAMYSGVSSAWFATV